LSAFIDVFAGDSIPLNFIAWWTGAAEGTRCIMTFTHTEWISCHRPGGTFVYILTGEFIHAQLIASITNALITARCVYAFLCTFGAADGTLVDVIAVSPIDIQCEAGLAVAYK
jgi:hypothetical protein